MKALDATLREPADSVRKIEVGCLDRLMLGVWQRAVGGDAEAIDRVLRIMDRRSKVLGLDSPQKIAPTHPEGTAEVTAGLAPGALDRLVAIIALAQARRDGEDSLR